MILMERRVEIVTPLIISDSLVNDFFHILLKPSVERGWLQKIVNLLLQITKSDAVTLCTYIDNVISFASNKANLNREVVSKNTLEFNAINPAEIPYWSGNYYVVPLSTEGCLQILWNKKPSEAEMKTYLNLFSFLASSLNIRSDLISKTRTMLHVESLSRIEKIRSSNSDFRIQITGVAKEIASLLNTSRTQIKIFSMFNNSVFDGSLSTEFVREGLLEAVSVIPKTENEWLEKLKKNEICILDRQQGKFVKNVDSLLSIQSILGYPLIWNDKPIGVLVLHQCDYERFWKEDELIYLKQASMMLNVITSKQNEIVEKNNKLLEINSELIAPDDFLREIHHYQIQAQVKNSCFSLLMIDIEKLKEINLRMGFVAGNLVLSQTARYLKRLFGEIYKIARYSNDEFVVIMESVDEYKAKVEAERLKDYLSNLTVLGVGTVEYNFSFVTYPTHSVNLSELLSLMEQAMILSKSRGKFQISSYAEIKDKPLENWQKLVSMAIPEIILKKSNLKTGPDVIEAINKQVSESQERKVYSADILDSVQSLAVALDAKDSYTEGHSKRVSEYAYMLAKSMGLGLQEIEWIRLAASMHDIGKIGIPENVLCKPGKLTKEEFEIMKKHPIIGAKILKPIKPLEEVANLVLYHHEYWDGSGYPDGLSKEKIPLGSRIVSIVDAYQAMTSSRPYRDCLPFDEAINRLIVGREKQWDPDLVDLFIKLVS